MARWRTAETVLPAALCCLSFGVYLWGTCPTIYWRDSSEFQWAGPALGIPHPPGSPVYVILAKAAAFLPFGSLGFRTNLLSAVSAALSILILCRIAVRMASVPSRVPSWPVALVGSCLILAPSPNFRLYAGVAEVYAAGALGAAVVLLAACYWFASGPPGQRDDRFAFATFFLVGLTSGIHVSAAAYVVPILLAMGFSEPRRVLRPRMFFGLAFFLILGLGVFLFVPLRAAAHPTLDWGRPNTAYRLRYHLLDQKDWPQPAPSPTSADQPGSEYKKPRRVAEEARPLAEAAAEALVAPGRLLKEAVRWHRFVLQLMSTELGILSGPLALTGAVWLLLRRQGPWLLLLGLVAWGHALFSIVVARWGSPYGYFPDYLIVALLGGLGLAAFAEVGARFGGAGARVAGWVVCSAAFVALALTRIPSGDPGKGEYWSTYRFGMELFRGLPPRATVLAAHYWPIMGYLHFCEGVRPDVNVLYRNEIYQSQQFYPDARVQPDLSLPREGLKALPSMRWFLEANLPDRPVFWQSEWDDGIFADGLVAQGPLLRFATEGSHGAGDHRELDEFYESWSRILEEARGEGGKLDLDEREDLAYVPFRLGNFILAKRDCAEAKRWLELADGLVGGAYSYSWVPELRKDLELVEKGQNGPCPGIDLVLVDTSVGTMKVDDRTER